MSEFYEIDSTRVSLREYWWGSKSPLVLVIALIIKWLRIRLPNSSDDPNVDSTLPFVTETLPPGIATSFQPLTDELGALEFGEPVYQIIHDPGTRTTVYWATFLHSSGKHFARIHHRVWQQAQKSDRGLFPIFFTSFTDGTFLVSSAGKPDMAAPEAVQMNRMRGANTAKLWAEHLRLENVLSGRKMISPVKTREELLGASERHHILVRDFHLGRRVFRPRTATEQVKVEAYTAAVAEAQASGLEYPEVLAEMDRLQEKKPSWANGIWILAGSLVAFIAAGAANWDWKFTLWIIPVLIFHEGGHWVAMRLCNYRNLRMFFIPFFGAAVTGQNWNVPGWKKALVSLAGPIPGIALGMVVGVAALVLRRPWMNYAALLLLFVNALNLVPVFPLDGGRVLQDTLFCRNRWLDIAFRILAMIGLAGLGLVLGAKLLPYLAIPMAFALPVAFRLGRVTDQLRQQPLPAPSPGEDRVPAATAQAIIKAVREVFPAKLKVSNKVLAQHALTVFERLNAKPPGVLATISLLAVQAGAFAAAVVVGILLIVDKNGGLRNFTSAAARQPHHIFKQGDVQTWPDRSVRQEILERNLVVATLKNREAARTAFSELTNRSDPGASITRLADSILVCVPVSDDASRERWFDTLQARCTNTFVALSNSTITAYVSCIAPTEEVATNLTREVSEYFQVANRMHLIAPWSPEARETEFSSRRRAREQWWNIDRQLGEVWSDPSLVSYGKRIGAALRRGATAEVARLQKEQTQKHEELQARVRDRLRQNSKNGVDPELLDLHAKLDRAGMTNRVERKGLLREVAGKLGEVQYAGERPAPEAERYGVSSGYASGHGLLVQFSVMSFYDVRDGLPAMAEWLGGLGCREIKYDLQGPGWPGQMDDVEEEID